MTKEAQEHGAGEQKPEQRQRLMEHAAGLRRAIADAETKRTEAARRGQEDEAEAAQKQERIRAVLGTDKTILETVRQEGLALNQMYARVANDLRAELTALEKRPKEPVTETAQELTPDLIEEEPQALAA